MLDNMTEFDNVSSCHIPITIDEDNSVLRVICSECKHQYFIRKDPNKKVPEIRQYVEIFRKDALQGNDNLFYKYYDRYLRK